MVDRIVHQLINVIFNQNLTKNVLKMILKISKVKEQYIYGNKSKVLQCKMDKHKIINNENKL